ncbi:MAG: hypothetical protein AAF432_11545 [Planctomycetota bacterium]
MKFSTEGIPFTEAGIEWRSYLDDRFDFGRLSDAAQQAEETVNFWQDLLQSRPQYAILALAAEVTNITSTEGLETMLEFDRDFGFWRGDDLCVSLATCDVARESLAVGTPHSDVAKLIALCPDTYVETAIGKLDAFVFLRQQADDLVSGVSRRTVSRGALAIDYEGSSEEWREAHVPKVLEVRDMLSISDDVERAILTVLGRYDLLRQQQAIVPEMGPSPSPPSKKGQSVLSILASLDLYESRTAPELAEALSKKGIDTDEKTLRSHVIPALREWGVATARGKGYYIDRQHAMGWRVLRSADSAT